MRILNPLDQLRWSFFVKIVPPNIYGSVFCENISTCETKESSNLDVRLISKYASAIIYWDIQHVSVKVNVKSV